MSSTRPVPPRAFVTEPGALDALALPAVRVATGTEGRLCADVARRQSMGLRKYGTTVADNPLPLRHWLQHAYEEALDQAVYLRRAMEELDRPQP